MFMGASANDDNYEFSDMNWGFCNSCGCVQLLELIDPDKLYKVSHNPSIGATWVKHNEEFSNVIKSYKIETVIDIGGANLKLANIISSLPGNQKYNVVDYSSKAYKCTEISDKINLVRCSIENYQMNNLANGIVMSHTFEHIYDPVSLLKNVRNYLNDDGRIFLSVPNIKQQLKDGFLNAMSFEHTFFIDHQYIEFIANNAGYELERRVDFSSHNSFYVFKKGITKPCVHSSPTESRHVFETFVENLKNEVASINSKMLTNDEEYYIFGAHMFAQYLINFGLNCDRIVGIVDNDAGKIGNYLYGTSFKVIHPDELNKKEKVSIIVRAAQYTAEIVSQLKMINPSITIM
jgi:2-polyprenyl-3-methyl-5-hydroxy-6-metoxy-1,4-benzoquinol methylase